MDKPRVVVVGAGFGGLACAQALGRAGVRTTVIDRNNYNLFAPLLYQVATAALSPADVAEPIRRILSRYPSVDVVLGEVVGVDWQNRRVLRADGGVLPYDRLVLATGSVYSYFGHEDWAEVAVGLKTIENARRIRTRILDAFELAEICDDPERRAMLMTTVIIGGGPTGVEMAGAVAELARYTLARDFRRIDPRDAVVILVEAGPRLLPSFPEALSDYARWALEKLMVTVVTGHAVEAVEPGAVTVAGRRIPCATVVWGAGVAASPAARWLCVEADRAGRVAVGADLAVHGRPGVFAIGDTALALDSDGKPLPGLAQVAKQQGLHLGRALAAELGRGEPLPPFRFRNRGNTAIVGRSAAVFDFGRWHLRGWPAWLLWALVHVYLLVGFENRLLVAMQWLWRWLTYERGARLITREADRRQDIVGGGASGADGS
jgi:NADH dehydrogenase